MPWQSPRISFLPRNIPTEFTEHTELSAEIYSHRFQISTDANFRGCTCLKCTNRAMLIYLLLCWCT